VTPRFTPHGTSFVRTTLAEADSLLYVTTIQTIHCNGFEYAWCIVSSRSLSLNKVFLTAKPKRLQNVITHLWYHQNGALEITSSGRREYLDSYQYM
jgi:hypothetical protein